MRLSCFSSHKISCVILFPYYIVMILRNDIYWLHKQPPSAQKRVRDRAHIRARPNTRTCTQLPGPSAAPILRQICASQDSHKIYPLFPSHSEIAFANLWFISRRDDMMGSHVKIPLSPSRLCVIFSLSLFSILSIYFVLLRQSLLLRNENERFFNAQYEK